MRVRHPHGLEAQGLGQLDLLDDLRDRLRGEDTEVEFHVEIIANGTFGLYGFLVRAIQRGHSTTCCRQAAARPVAGPR